MRGRNPEALERFSRLVDGPLLVLALLMVPLLVAPLIVEVSPAIEDVLLLLDYLIWAVFAAEYVIKLYLSPERWRFVRTHPLELVLILVPFLRPLRVLRSMRLLRAARASRAVVFVGKALRQFSAVFGRRGVNYVLLIVGLVVLVAAGLIVEFESGSPDSNIKSFEDGLWWAVVTVTTVGYGDRFPVTQAGRGIGFALMILGIATFGVLTASIAAYFVETEPDESKDKLDEILERLRAIDAQLAASGPATPSAPGGPQVPSP